MNLILRLAEAPTSQMTDADVSSSSLRGWGRQLNAINVKLAHAIQKLPSEFNSTYETQANQLQAE
mgnify:CR=1 FL=1